MDGKILYNCMLGRDMDRIWTRYGWDFIFLFRNLQSSQKSHNFVCTKCKDQLPIVVRMTVGRMETGAPQGNRHGLEPKTDIPCSQAP